MKKLNWNQYFQALSKVAATRSKDPNTQVGAVLVNKNNRVIGMGYNGMPLGDDDFPWGREGKPEDTKYPYVVHAEMNAILNAIADTYDSKIYVSLFPCASCAKFLCQAGIKEILYTDDIYDGTEDNIIAKRIFKQLNIKLTKLPDVKVTIG